MKAIFSKLRNGFGILTWANGDKYEGRWEEDMKSGYGREYLAKIQEYYEGKFERDKREGDGRIITSQGEILDVKYLHGIKSITSIVPKIMKQEKYIMMINNFLKKRSIIEPEIIIMP